MVGGGGSDQGIVLPVEDSWISGMSVDPVVHPPMADASDNERSRSRIFEGVAVAKAAVPQQRGFSPSYTLQQREAQIRRLQEELATERMRSANEIQSSRVANEHLERLAREDAARAQAEHSRATQETVHEIAALRARVQALSAGEQAMADSRAAQVAAIEQIAERHVNAEVANVQGLQSELRRVESTAETAQSQLAEQSRQEVDIVRNLLSSAEGQTELSQNRARLLEQRLQEARYLLHGRQAGQELF